MTKHILTLRGVEKRFTTSGTEKVVLQDFNLSVGDGEYIAIFGPNGCGKSSLLNIISGLDLNFNGQRVSELNLPDGDIGFVFQDYNQSVFPWLNVKKNIELSLHQTKRRKESDESFFESAQEICDYFNFQLPLHANTYQLSGGQKQIVALFRAIINKPKLLLLDEPFASLDYINRKQFASLIREIHDRLKITIVMVTHDLEEAMLHSDRLVVLSQSPASIMIDESTKTSRTKTLADISGGRFKELRSEVLRGLGVKDV